MKFIIDDVRDEEMDLQDLDWLSEEELGQVMNLQDGETLELETDQMAGSSFTIKRIQ